MNKEHYKVPLAKKQKLDSRESKENYFTMDKLDNNDNKLKILDKVQPNDEDTSYESDGLSEDISQDEIEKMLDEGLPAKYKRAPKRKKNYVMKNKIFMEEKGVNPFKGLPPDWIGVRHESGMPIYLHRPSTVCTLAKPFFLGKGNARTHDIPLNAIPCYAYRKALEAEEKQRRDDRKIAEQIRSSRANYAGNVAGAGPKQGVKEPVVWLGGADMPPPRVVNMDTSRKTKHLTTEQLNDYCKKLFKFKAKKIKKFKSCADRRVYNKVQRTLQCPKEPPIIKVISIPERPGSSGQKNRGRANNEESELDMTTTNHLAVLQDYVTKTMQKNVVYEIIKNNSALFQATVVINGKKYGVGVGHSRTQAKLMAARNTIILLIPGLKVAKNTPNADADEPVHEFFDCVDITNHDIPKFSGITCVLYPLEILKNCLRILSTGHNVKTEIKLLDHQKVELTMKVGEYTVILECPNRKTGTQVAAQYMLQALHPNLVSWGSLLRRYGSRAAQGRKQKKLEDKHITQLQHNARRNGPNYAVLEKLRTEMMKLRERDAAVVSIRSVLACDDLPTLSGSNLHNVDL